MSKSIYRDEYRVLIDLLREAREQAGVTQGEVAKAFAWPQSTMSHVERGSRRLDLVEFLDYCKALGTDPSNLFAEFLTRLGRRARSAETPPRRKAGSSAR